MKNSIFVLCFYIAILFASVGGWILNLIKVFNAEFSTITGVLVVRVIGVFVAPIGSIFGWF